MKKYFLAGEMKKTKLVKPSKRRIRAVKKKMDYKSQQKKKIS